MPVFCRHRPRFGGATPAGYSVLAIGVHLGVRGGVVPDLGGVAPQRVVLKLAHQPPAVDPPGQVAAIIIHERTGLSNLIHDRKME